MENPYLHCPVAITGGCGFIGSHLAEQLVSLGADVSIIDNLSTGRLQNIAHLEKHVRLVAADITNKAACARAFAGARIVFHLAACTSVAESLKKAYQYQKVNIHGTYTVLEAARRAGVSRVVFSSSAAVYGVQNTLCREDMPCAPLSLYGYSKQIGELLCAQYLHLFGLHTTILRYFNVYGPRQEAESDNASVVARFRHQMAHGLPITIYGDGQQMRDFVPVSHVVDANIRLALAPQAVGQIFNIASGSSITLLELVERLKIEYPAYHAPLVFKSVRAGDIVYSMADCSKYQSLVEHTPPSVHIPVSAVLREREVLTQL